MPKAPRVVPVVVVVVVMFCDFGMAAHVVAKGEFVTSGRPYGIAFVSSEVETRQDGAKRVSTSLDSNGGIEGAAA